MCRHLPSPSIAPLQPTFYRSTRDVHRRRCLSDSGDQRRGLGYAETLCGELSPSVCCKSPFPPATRSVSTLVICTFKDNTRRLRGCDLRPPRGDSSSSSSSSAASPFLESPDTEIIVVAKSPQEPLTRRTDDSSAYAHRPQSRFATDFTVTPVSAAACSYLQCCKLLLMELQSNVTGLQWHDEYSLK